MDSGNRDGRSAGFWVLLAGLESGMIGGLIMLLWFAVGSAWYDRSIWSFPNLLATTFHGDGAFRRGFRWTTPSGLALHLAACGAVGTGFGLLVQGLALRARVMLLGLVFAMGWYYLSFWFLWKKVNPLVPLYSPDRLMLVGHLLLGAALGRFPARLRSIERSSQPGQ